MGRRVPSIKYSDLVILPSLKSSLVQILIFARNDLLSAVGGHSILSGLLVRVLL